MNVKFPRVGIVAAIIAVALVVSAFVAILFQPSERFTIEQQIMTENKAVVGLVELLIINMEVSDPKAISEIKGKWIPLQDLEDMHNKIYDAMKFEFPGYVKTEEYSVRVHVDNRIEVRRSGVTIGLIRR